MRTLAVVAALAACSSHAPHGAAPAPGSDVGDVVAPPVDRPPAETPAPSLRLPTSFAPTAYRAHLVLDPAQPRFDGEITIDATLASDAPVVWLHAEKLTIDRADATAGAVHVPLTATMSGTHFLALRGARTLPAGAITLHLAYHGEVSDQDRQGAWRRQWDGAWYAFTQFESVSARRVFPCVDEPSSKVPWQLTLDVPAGDVALSNTNAKKSSAGKLDRYEFATTRPLPSYLVAFAVGPFALVDAGTTPGGKPIRIATPARRAGEAAYAAKVTAKVIAHLEAYFGTPYPYDKLDEVTTAGRSGAMENAGMITYAENLLLIDPEDPSRSRRIAYDSVAAHEIAHHWFGDLVTTAWWDDIWLNEAFATWMQDKMLAELDPDAHGDLAAVSTLAYALGADDLSAARMVRQPIKSEDDIYSAFDSITYMKGASVIRMFERWAEPAKFQAGVRAYLAAHADRNATADDFLDAISAAAGKDVKTPFATFLDQPGAPRITATVRCDAGKPPAIALHQERYLPRGAAAAEGAPVWQVPVCAVYDDHGKAARACTLLTAADGTLALDGAACPSWAYANAGATGYYRVAMTGEALAALVGKGWSKLAESERLELASDVSAMVAHGDVDAGVALDLVPRLLAEKSSVAIEAAARIGARVEPFVPAAQRDAYAAWIRRTYGPLAAKLGWTAKHGEDDDTQRVRNAVVPLVAITGGDPALRKQAVALAAGWQKLPSSIAAPVLEAAVDDAKTFEALYAQVHTVSDRRQSTDLLNALASVHDTAKLARVLALSLDPTMEWSQVIGLAGSTASDPASRSAGAAFAREHLDALEARMPDESRAYLVYAVVEDCDPTTRDGAVAKAETLRGTIGGPRAVAQAIERLDECLAQKGLQGPALARYFAKK